MHGTVNDEKKAKMEEARKGHEKLWNNVAALADTLDRDGPPPIDEEEDEEEEDEGDGLTLWTSAGAAFVEGGGAYDDEETRAFYEDLPDLLATVTPDHARPHPTTGLWPPLLVPDHHYLVATTPIRA